MDSLTCSIERYGVITPISVRACGADEYELISGERRYRAAFYAGLREIPCIVLDTDGSDCAILSLLENLQREELSFLEIAESYKQLVKKKGMTSSELSRKIGDKPYDVREKIDLMRLDPLVRKYIRSFELSERQARSLLKLHDKSRQLEAARYICENGLNESETASFVMDMLKSDKEPKLHINKIKDIKVLRNTLTHAVNLIRSSGVSAELSENVYDWGEEFVVTVKKVPEEI